MARIKKERGQKVEGPKAAKEKAPKMKKASPEVQAAFEAAMKKHKEGESKKEKVKAFLKRALEKRREAKKVSKVVEGVEVRGSAAEMAEMEEMLKAAEKPKPKIVIKGKVPKPKVEPEEKPVEDAEAKRQRMEESYRKKMAEKEKKLTPAKAKAKELEEAGIPEGINNAKTITVQEWVKSVKEMGGPWKGAQARAEKAKAVAVKIWRVGGQTHIEFQKHTPRKDAAHEEHKRLGFERGKKYSKQDFAILLNKLGKDETFKLLIGTGGPQKTYTRKEFLSKIEEGALYRIQIYNGQLQVVKERSEEDVERARKGKEEMIRKAREEANKARMLERDAQKIAERRATGVGPGAPSANARELFERTRKAYVAAGFPEGTNRAQRFDLKKVAEVQKVVEEGTVKGITLRALEKGFKSALVYVNSYGGLSFVRGSLQK